MLFDWLLDILGYRKIVKAPSYSEFVKKKEERVEYLNKLAVPLLKKIVDDFINNGEYIRSIIQHIYHYREMEVTFSFQDWAILDKTGYEYTFSQGTLRFTVHKRYQVYDFDYVSVFYKELAEGLTRYELTVNRDDDYGEWNIVPLNKETDEKAVWCNKAMAVS